MKRTDAFPSKYLSKDDLSGPTLGVIDAVVIETLGQGDEQETKPVLYWKSGLPKPMVINNTNWQNVEALYGDDSDGWMGKTVEVWVDPAVSFGGKRIGGLRLRAPSTETQPNPMTPSQTWNLFVNQSGATLLDVQAALKVDKVSEWLAADPARTLNDAMQLVSQQISEKF